MIKLTSLALLIVLIVPLASLAEQEITWLEAEAIVKKLPAQEGGTVDEYLNKKAQIPVVEDLGWHTYLRDFGYEIERLMLLNDTTPLRYKWNVTFDGIAWPLNGQAIAVTKGYGEVKTSGSNTKLEPDQHKLKKVEK